MKPWPEPCPTCGSEAKLRKVCEHCDSPEYVIAHDKHYMGGALEVFPCLCSTHHANARKRLAYARKVKRETGRTKIEHPSRTTVEEAKKVAEGMAAGMSQRAAMLAAGFSKNRAEGGKKALNRMIRTELKHVNHRYIDAARDLTPEDQELMVRGMLLEAVSERTDKGVLAAKQLGADKRVAMWTPDSQVGMVILQAPPIPKIDHPVPLFPVEQDEAKEPPVMILKSQEHEEEPEEKNDEEPEHEVPSEAEVWEEEERKREGER